MRTRSKKIKTLKPALWKLFTLYQKLVHSHDGEWCSCYTCGKAIKIGTKDCQGGHCWSKAAFSAIYFDERAVRPQCSNCNAFCEGRHDEFNDNLKQEIGMEAWQDLKDNRSKTVKRSWAWYWDQIDYYDQALKEVKEARGWE